VARPKAKLYIGRRSSRNSFNNIGGSSVNTKPIGGSSVNTKPVSGSSVNKKSVSGSWVILKVFGGNPVNCRKNICY
jgi:hypothetical protein